MLVLQMCIAAACMLQSRASSLSPVLPLVRNPAVFQLDARIATRELSLRKGSPATLNDLTDDELDDFAEAGFDAIYLMGVWQTGENGVLNAQKRLLAQRAQSAERMGDTADCTMEAVAEGLDAAGSDTIAGSAPGGSEAATAAEAAAAAAEEAAILAQTQLERDLPGQAPLDSAVGFPTAIIDYSVNTKLGGNNALAALRTRLRERGLRLLLDFVPNHMAADHPWTVTNPQLLVRGSVDDLKREPQNYYQVGEGGLGVFAHGRDPYFDGWEDTVQLNYASAELRQEMCETLARIATMCDGVRCDMAMLQCPSVFQQTWATHLEPQGFDFACLFEPDKLFWPAAIAAARAVNKDFLLVGEVYWGREYDLQQYGFDYTLDKVAYEQLQEGRADDFRQHLARDDAAFLLHSARYLETHEEKRASEVFSDEHEEAGTYRHFAAAIAAYTLPGMRLFNDGQLQGRKLQIPLFLAWRDNAEKRDSRVSAWYSRLLSSVLSRPEVREGEAVGLRGSERKRKGKRKRKRKGAAGERARPALVSPSPLPASHALSLCLPVLFSRATQTDMLANPHGGAAWRRWGRPGEWAPCITGPSMDGNPR